MTNVSIALTLIGDTFQARIGIWKWFLRRGENWSTQRKTLWSREENQQQTQTQPMTPGPGIKPTTHWWEASAFTTVLF